MIIILGHVHSKPETHQRMLEIGIEHSRRSRAEPGCLAHNCHVDAETPNKIMFVEKWVDMAAVQAHFAVPESGAMVKEMRALSSSPAGIELFDAQQLAIP